jgi:hypothetical protein
VLIRPDVARGRNAPRSAEPIEPARRESVSACEVMMLNLPDDHDALLRRIEADLLDGYDEELELEIEDRDLTEPPVPGSPAAQARRADRQSYFRELFRLQGELVKLQDWVAQTGQKVVIVFEGRDSGRQGRRHQAHHPAPESARVCRVVALPAPTDRERTQWYFQRYVRRICRRPAKWCCSTAAGTTGPVSNG